MINILRDIILIVLIVALILFQAILEMYLKNSLMDTITLSIAIIIIGFVLIILSSIND